MHYNPVRIHMGKGCRKDIAELLPNSNQKYLFVTSEGMVKRGTARELMQYTQAQERVYTVKPNPDLDILDADIKNFRNSSNTFDAIVALGGGSAMDAAKALCYGLAENAPENPLDAWLRKNNPIKIKPLPLFCIPTTAGTGSEVTPFATIWDTTLQKKFSLKDEDAFAHTALLDPELTLSLPYTETLIGALDAFSHAMETLWNVKATSYSVACALAAIDIVCEHFPRIKNDLQNINSRQALQEAACLAGLAISQNQTSIAHAISYPLTLHFGMPHGFACSLLLAPIAKHVTKHNAWHPMALGRYKKAINFLEQYALVKYFNQYCSAEQAIKFIGEMFTPERASTFSAPVNKDDVKSFLRTCNS